MSASSAANATLLLRLVSRRKATAMASMTPNARLMLTTECPTELFTMAAVTRYESSKGSKTENSQVDIRALKTRETLMKVRTPNTVFSLVGLGM